MVTHDDVRAFALSLPEAFESEHFGTPDFRVRNHIFVTLPPAMTGKMVVKMAPENLALLHRIEPDTYSDAWRGSWAAVQLDRIDMATVRDLVTESWRRTAPKSLQNKLTADAG